MLNSIEIQFIKDHQQEDVSKLAFQKKKYPHLDFPKLLFQIQARQKLKAKLPTWVNNDQIFFPPQISLEQSSSEKTALFKAKLIFGKIIDLTGGMGLDSWAFAQEKTNEVTYVEINEPLKEISQYNHQVFGLEQIKHFHADGMKYIKNESHNFDWIYLDPARRDKTGKKVFLLKDCTPDATQILPYINEHTNLLVKVSPMLDIDLCIKELNGVDEVHIVCVQNEVKELLFKKTKKSSLNPLINVWELQNSEQLLFSQTKQAELETSSEISSISTYLYEPHAGILKAGFFKSIQSAGVFKLASNTHLYTSEKIISDFPGKKYQVLATGKLDLNWIKAYIKDNRANISCRNFPLKPEEIRKKLKLSDGGNITLFAYRDQNNLPILSICQKNDF